MINQEYYFYKTINLVNNKCYYGSGTKKIYNGSGKTLKKAILKYGKDNFITEKLRFFSTRKEAFDFEERFLSLFDIANNPNCYNIVNRGSGGNRIDYNSEKAKEYKRLCSIRMTSMNKTHESRTLVSIRMKDSNPMFNLESRFKSSDKLRKWKELNGTYGKGKHRTEDTKKKISETRKSRGIQPYNKGIIMEKNCECYKCKKMFSKQGLTRHINFCKS
jgi:hypothetical protein